MTLISELPKMLSDNFSMQEAIISQTAERNNIDNIPTSGTAVIMQQAATKLEKVRLLLLSYPININSWYRSPALNTAVGSKSTSQHLKGEAIDFICPQFGTPLDICKLIIANKDLINYDQLILEHTWVHISFSILQRQPKNQVLSLLATGGYATGLTDKKGNLL
jgi:hypothetical protein